MEFGHTHSLAIHLCNTTANPFSYSSMLPNGANYNHSAEYIRPSKLLSKSLHYYTSTCSIILYAFIPEVEALHRFWKEKSRVRTKLLLSGCYLDLVRDGSLLVPIRAAIIPCSICLPLYPSRLSDFTPTEWVHAISSHLF